MAWTQVALDDIYSDADITDDVSWLKACHDIDAGACMVLRNGDVFMPLRYTRQHGLVRVESLGQRYRSVAGPLGANGREMPEIHPEDLPEKADIIDLRRFPQHHIDNAFPFAPARLTHTDSKHFARSLEPTSDAFLLTLAKNTKKDLRYSANRVGKVFGEENVHYEQMPLNEANWNETWDKASAIVPYTWQGKSGVSMLTNDSMKLFLSQLVKHGMAVVFHLYRINDDPAAVVVSMNKNGKVLIYSHEYNENYAKYQPGHLLNMRVILDAIAQGNSWLDFGVGDTPHKYLWRCQPQELWRILVPLTWKGVVAATYQNMRWKVGARLYGKISEQEQ